MLFPDRTWCLTEVPSSQALARMLTKQTWCRFAAFFVEGHDSVLFFNDATSPDGAQEYGVMFRSSRGVIHQVDSITFSWCTTERAKWLIDQFHDVRPNQLQLDGRIVPDQIETPEKHRTRLCPLCA